MEKPAGPCWISPHSLFRHPTGLAVLGACSARPWAPPELIRQWNRNISTHCVETKGDIKLKARHLFLFERLLISKPWFFFGVKGIHFLWVLCECVSIRRLLIGDRIGMLHPALVMTFAETSLNCRIIRRNPVVVIAWLGVAIEVYSNWYFEAQVGQVRCSELWYGLLIPGKIFCD
jgi:hypothetical protein